jgi:ribulose-phosphate 3-epimerase
LGTSSSLLFFLLLNHTLPHYLWRMKHLIAPSILSADFANLGRDIKMINDTEADWFHVDVMDGRFVPNISFGLPVIAAIKPIATKPFDVHLMIVYPDNFIEAFRNAGADHLTVHIEACPNLHRTLQRIKETGMKAGVAVNPHTAINQLDDIIHDIDIVCLMSVNPGFGGQKFIEHTFAKTEKLKNLILQKNAKTLIEIDGGVTLDNARQLVDAGADVLVAGNTVFKSANPKETISKLKQLVS